MAERNRLVDIQRMMQGAGATSNPPIPEFYPYVIELVDWEHSGLNVLLLLKQQFSLTLKQAGDLRTALPFQLETVYGERAATDALERWIELLPGAVISYRRTEEGPA